MFLPSRKPQMYILKAKMYFKSFGGFKPHMPLCQVTLLLTVYNLFICYTSIMQRTVFTLKNTTLQPYTSLTLSSNMFIFQEHYRTALHHEMLRTWQDLFFSCSKLCARSWRPLQPTSKPAVIKKSMIKNWQVSISII